MSARIIPRLCRRNVLGHPRWMSTRHNKNVPMFWHRQDPWETNFFGRPFDSHFRDMAKMMDSFMHQPFLQNYVRPKEIEDAFKKTEVAEVKYDNKKLEVKLDVSMYAPEELNISITDDRLVIKGKHEQKADNHGYISREFTREFVIPENIDPETITSTLSEQGMLMIQGRAKGASESHERSIPIEKEKKEE